MSFIPPSWAFHVYIFSIGSMLHFADSEVTRVLFLPVRTTRLKLSRENQRPKSRLFAV